MLFTLLLCSGIALGDDAKNVNISTAKDLIAFAEDVNAGTNFSGKTVYLTKDIDFISEGYGDTFYPIGHDTDKTFAGTFDGQGHVISNLRIGLSYYDYVSLFGYSEGMTIRNLVMDSTNLFDNFRNREANSAIAAGIICHCAAIKRDCVIENSINMGEVVFSAAAIAAGVPVYLSGIVGQLTVGTGAYSARVTNCVNYGTVSHTGSAQGNTHIGGVVGRTVGTATNIVNVRNSANHGAIVMSGSAKNTYIGGITGEAQYSALDNCFSGSLINSTIKGDNIGTVVGSVDSSDCSITHCLWTAAVGYSKVNGGSGEAAVINSTSVEPTEATLDSINEYVSRAAEEYAMCKWVALNTDGGKIGSSSESEAVITILRTFPKPVKEGSKFLYWCIDTQCDEVYDPSNGNDTMLYAEYRKLDYTLSLDLGNGTVITSKLNFNDAIVYPTDVDRSGYFFAGWNSTLTVMPAENIAISAVWLKIEEFVELSLGTTSIKESEYESTVAKYATAGSYKIVDFEAKDGATKVVIKFSTISEAEKFVKGIQASTDAENIQSYNFLPEYKSLSFTLQPLCFITSLLIF